ncbi:hypothetical protein P40081_15220 [Paenibacillus sp. FSL P4-0081]|uniref:hypothetical protein n=1 Tax=Paenibacillus sp. FSL P4-0081 TaxID=1536769 RepID=UPI0004F8D07C|nr:hypothetical protein [Paenibacillus sp. FSL P4-0081]AIQ29348.1 hypothetical protein P40081_15220 [Paenibacillus sp. FSL P4-0081]
MSNSNFTEVLQIGIPYSGESLQKFSDEKNIPISISINGYASLKAGETYRVTAIHRNDQTITGYLVERVNKSFTIT